MANGGCEVRKKADIPHIRAVNNISYAEAVEKVQGQKVRAETVSSTSGNSKSKTDGTDKFRSHSGKDHVAYCLCDNGADQVQQDRKNKFIFAKGAEKIFEVKAVTWEHVNETFGGDGKPGTPGEKVD